MVVLVVGAVFDEQGTPVGGDEARREQSITCSNFEIGAISKLSLFLSLTRFSLLGA